MISTLSIGLSAGLASALLFASVSSGSAFAMVLFYAAPLPILITGLGWRHYAGLLAAVTAAAVLALALNPIFLVAFLAGIGAPAWLLAYLALLARPNARGEAEWYPVGRLLFWAAMIAAAGVSIGVIALGTSEEAYTAALRAAVEQVLRLQTGLPADQPLTLPGVDDVDSAVKLMITVLPLTAAVLSMLTALLNLWGAGRVVRASGRLVRPWPDLTEVRLPGFAASVFAVAAALSLVGGLVGIVAGLFAATLAVAYSLTGLSLLHAITRGYAGRGFMLGISYVAILLFGWPLLFFVFAGLADAFLDLRRRQPGLKGPPGPKAPPAPPPPNDQ
ncbi:DUF2232 domain-containing protein [Blastochloris sulfoviridis]|uniref:DUF2232 domain-containing protein n=1 Tax=Blastochloris sulfoviridis TaxID=50712 RepID=A0A5M6HIC9_9HYPH|nr:DUF2232 domain-containing protein [Blastochloris sulfoviridis]KAA5595597.1 DUF2232 domain-containing protein [Blastochloris sulfoviridis]